MHILNNLKILVVFATQAEYGPNLQKLFPNPHMIGVGPIEATFQLTKLLMDLKHKNDLPEMIFSLGTAGSQTLQQAELYQISTVSYRDMDARAFGFQKGVTPFVDYPAEFPLRVLSQKLKTARLATGGSVIDQAGTSGQRFDDIDADCVDMETYAIARIAFDFKIPLFGLRGISDGNKATQGIQSWEEYLSEIDQKMADFLADL